MMASRADIERRLYEEQAAQQYGPPVSMMPKPKVKKASPYAAAKAAAAPKPDPGQVQPNFAAVPTISMDPFDQPELSAPVALTGAAPIGRGPGAQDLLTNKFSKDRARQKQVNVYQDPEEYRQHLETVMSSPLMKELAQGADRFKQLREDYLKNAPQQTDLSPVMAFADYLAKGKGNAMAGYKRPAGYEETVSRLGDLSSAEQKARQMEAQLAYEQAGGLKKGEDQAQVKEGIDKGRVQGYKQPNPMAGMNNPLNQALAIQRAFQSLPTYKDAEKEVTSAQAMRDIMSNPSWVSDFALRGQMLQSMKIAPISEKEMAEFGMGSPDLFNKIHNIVKGLSAGRTLSPLDYKAIEEFAAQREAYGRKKMEAVQSSFAQGISPYSPLINERGIHGITNPAVPPQVSQQPGAESEDDKAFKKLLEKF